MRAPSAPPLDAGRGTVPEPAPDLESEFERADHNLHIDQLLFETFDPRFETAVAA